MSRASLPDFFTRQTRASRQTGLLLLLFVGAVCCTILLMNLLVGAVCYLFGWSNQVFWHPYSGWVIVLMLLVIVIGSIQEWYQLRDGGRSIARRMQARRLVDQPDDPQERQLRNVAEEMAIAAGQRCPVLYILDDEAAINAFVAGQHPLDMVMVLTKGSVQTLDRDELQGVVAHEFSHIKHGDPRVNLHLMAVLGGLLWIGQLGQGLLQFGRPSVGQRERIGWEWLWWLVGGVIWLVGSVGVLSGRLIKLAILRQREFLADASSQQFTRSTGVLRALLRVRAHPQGSTLTNRYAESVSHLCFSSALHVDDWFSTHPPLDQRIGSLDRDALRRVRVRDRILQRQQQGVDEVIAMQELQTLEQVETQPSANDPIEWCAPKVLPTLRREIQRPCAEQHAAVMPQVQRFAIIRPEAVKRALITGAGCRELLAAILAVRQQLVLPPDDFSISHALFEGLAELDPRGHLPLFHDALWGVQDLPHCAARTFLDRLTGIVQSDGQVSLSDVLLLEWFKATVGLLPDSLPVALEDCAQDVKILVEGLLQLQQLSAAQQDLVRHRILRTVLAKSEDIQHPNLLAQALPTDKRVYLAQVLARLAGLPHHQRVGVLEVAETCLWADTRMSQEEQDVLDLLHWRFYLRPQVFDVEPAGFRLE
ncbi:MAG: M48 family metalloprotease [Pseudomonadota bacterium]|nr:M48 family metalloprotease [Pseudomonadota bacterium]